jgi:heme-binding NEAT domain protein
MPHTDGPSYYSKTATISIGGGDVLLKFTKRHPPEYAIQSSDIEPVMELQLSGKGSLIVFQNEAYIDYCHSIQDRLVDDYEVVSSNSKQNMKCINFKPNHGEQDSKELQMKVMRGYRISLTFRHKYTVEK